MTCSKAHSRRGFTLVELMVTVLVGSIVIAGVYSIYTASVRGYRVQNQALEGFASLRMATRQIKADLRSAGFNAPGQSNEETWVTTAPGLVLSAVAVDVDPKLPVVHQQQNESIAPQQIRLLGDFFSHRTYTSERITGQTVTLRWAPDDGDEDSFNRIFNNRRMLRIEAFGVARQEQYLPIVSASFEGGLNPEVTVSEPVQGVGGFGSGYELSVVGYVRYRLKRDERRSGSSMKFDLVREDLDPDGNPVDGSALITAENVVDLQVYDICLNTTAPEPGTMRQVPVAITCYPTLSAIQGSPYSLKADATNSSHLLRSMTVKVSVRSSFEDEELPFAPRTQLDEPLNAFDVDPAMTGAARVYEMATTVTLVSVQARRQ